VDGSHNRVLTLCGLPHKGLSDRARKLRDFPIRNFANSDFSESERVAVELPPKYSCCASPLESCCSLQSRACQRGTARSNLAGSTSFASSSSSSPSASGTFRSSAAIVQASHDRMFVSHATPPKQRRRVPHRVATLTDADTHRRRTRRLPGALAGNQALSVVTDGHPEDEDARGPGRAGGAVAEQTGRSLSGARGRAARRGRLGQNRANADRARARVSALGLAPRAGLEPATRGLEGRRSIQLSYRGE
jgi:hypothetical protein